MVLVNDGILSLSEVNALTPEQFEWLFGNVVEHQPNAAQHVAAVRPFTSVKNLKRSFYEYLDKLDVSEKENVLLGYPDLAGKLIDGGSFTAGAQFEQDNIEFESMSREEKQTLSAYNDLYKEKFRIPFVMHISDNNVQTIRTSIQARLENTRDQEINVAIREVKKICNGRINHLVWSDIMYNVSCK